MIALMRAVPAATGAARRVRPRLRVAGFRAGTGMAQRPVDAWVEGGESSEPPRTG